MSNTGRDADDLEGHFESRCVFVIVTCVIITFQTRQ